QHVELGRGARPRVEGDILRMLYDRGFAALERHNERPKWRLANQPLQLGSKRFDFHFVVSGNDSSPLYRAHRRVVLAHFLPGRPPGCRTPLPTRFVSESPRSSRAASAYVNNFATTSGLAAATSFVSPMSASRSYSCG